MQMAWNRRGGGLRIDSQTQQSPVCSSCRALRVPCELASGNNAIVISDLLF